MKDPLSLASRAIAAAHQIAREGRKVTGVEVAKLIGLGKSGRTILYNYPHVIRAIHGLNARHVDYPCRGYIDPRTGGLEVPVDDASHHSDDEPNPLIQDEWSLLCGLRNFLAFEAELEPELRGAAIEFRFLGKLRRIEIGTVGENKRPSITHDTFGR
jgi:hypothetical protein